MDQGGISSQIISDYQMPIADLVRLAKLQVKKWAVGERNLQVGKEAVVRVKIE